jgi:FkbM family methyltransferase
MSRFSNLRKYLSLAEAISVYRKVKFNNSENIVLAKLAFPFSLRNNPFDYATFEEVLLREEYDIDLDFTPATIIDAGANIGLTAIYLANRFPAATIVSIEPDKDNFALLKANTQAYKNIALMNCGLWSHEAYLQVIDEGKGNNAFTVKEIESDNGEAIKAIAINSIMQVYSWKTVDVLKIDIEGAEKIVFEKNYENWLPKIKVLIIELHDRMVPGSSHAVFKALNNYNFSFDIKGENIVFTNKDL